MKLKVIKRKIRFVSKKSMVGWITSEKNKFEYFLEFTLPQLHSFLDDAHGKYIIDLGYCDLL